MVDFPSEFSEVRFYSSELRSVKKFDSSCFVQGVVLMWLLTFAHVDANTTEAEAVREEASREWHPSRCATRCKSSPKLTAKWLENRWRKFSTNSSTQSKRCQNDQEDDQAHPPHNEHLTKSERTVSNTCTGVKESPPL